MSLLFLAATFVTSAASPSAQYQQYVLRAEQNVWDVSSADMNGDGNAEIFALCCDEDSDPLVKYVAVYMAGTDGAYPEKPTMRIDVDPGASTFFFAETDGAPPVELIAADAEGATVYQYQNGNFVAIAKPRFTSLLPYKSKEPFFMKNAAADLNGDGIDEWMIPQHNGYELRTLAGPLGFIECDVTSEISSESSVYIKHRLPAVFSFARAGEKVKGIGFLSDEFADFAYGPGWKQHSRFKIPINVDGKWEAGTRMEDIDGDGNPDLIVTQTKGTINMKSITHIYLAKGPFQYSDKPDAEFQVGGALMSPLIKDVDGDGKMDAVLVSIPLNAWNIINFFVRGKVSVQADVYLFKDGGFAKKANYSQDFLLDAPEGREQVAYTFGDFNGDGRLDALFGAGAQKLVINTGTPDRLVSAKPWVTLTLPAFGMAHKLKLNNNAAEDLVLAHPGGENKKRIDVVVF